MINLHESVFSMDVKVHANYGEAPWLSGIVPAWRSRGRWFEPHRRHSVGVVFLSKTLYLV